MTEDQDDLTHDPEFLRLKAKRGRMSLRFSLLVLAIFVTFVAAAVAFPETLSSRLSEGSELTILVVLLFFLMILPAFIAGLFMWRMDREIEPLRALLAKRRKS